MVTEFISNNEGFFLAVVYMFFYILLILNFILLIGKYADISDNITHISFIFKYSYRASAYILITYFVFLGVPPTALFPAKFAALTNAWWHGQGIVFFVLLTITLLSFAIYIQLFDLFFSTNDKNKYVLTAIENCKSGKVFYISNNPKKINWDVFLFFQIIFFFSFFFVADVFFFLINFI